MQTSEQDPIKEELTGILMEHGPDEGDEFVDSHFLAVVRLDGQPQDDAHDVNYNVNVWDPKLKDGDRVRIFLGVSETTPDGKYCEIERGTK